MNARLLAYWDDLRSSYWFIPSVMAVAAFGLSFATVYADGRVGADWIDSVPWLYANKPDGARQLLSTVAGSMIGVAGVTFSITIASVVYASGQYGPRLLTNFMADRGNQVTLGTFIATFLYCVLVLRTIRAADEGFGGANPSGDAVGPFVPHIALATALALALCSIGVFIYFIHHVPESIHVSNVIAGVGHELERKIDVLYPERIGRDAPTDAARQSDDVRTAVSEGFFDHAAPVLSARSGYLQGIDAQALLDLATAHDLLLRVRFRPGDFVSEGDPLVHAGASGAAEALSDEAVGEVRDAFVFGRQRTARQDARFLVNELVEIAARALSPGVNDPFTAMSCLDWLGTALKRLADRDFPGAERFDDAGALRIVAAPTVYREFVGHVFAQLRPYLASDRNAALHALKTIGEVAGRATDADQRAALRHQADALLEGAEATLTVEADKQSIRERHRTVVRLLAGHVSYAEATADTDWIGGTG